MLIMVARPNLAAILPIHPAFLGIGALAYGLAAMGAAVALWRNSSAAKGTVRAWAVIATLGQVAFLFELYRADRLPPLPLPLFLVMLLVLLALPWAVEGYVRHQSLGGAA